MTAVQSVASKRFISAMGSMVENQAAVDQVLSYIEWMKHPANLPMITMEQLEKNGMPLHVAMDSLRKKAHNRYHNAVHDTLNYNPEDK